MPITSKNVNFNIHLRERIVNTRNSVNILSDAVDAILGETKKITDELLHFNQKVIAIQGMNVGVVSCLRLLNLPLKGRLVH